ncbi:MAG: pilus assembly protein PilM [Candidatus Zixiibacteriota bacterium]|nr:MAG: pilus assembly protein PilM [candidate division Zixibacteria bacterium]
MLGVKQPSDMASRSSVIAPGTETGDRPVLTWKWVQPKRQYRLGRFLACCIEDQAIQLAAAKSIGTRQTLVDVRKVYIASPKATGEERAIFIANTLREYVAEFGGRYPNISICISGPETAYRTLEMPALSRRELAAALVFEAKRNLPFPVEQSVFDYRTIQESTDKGSNGIKVALLAATGRLLTENLAPFDQLNLEVEHVYHVQDVIGQMLRNIRRFSEAKSYAVLNVKQDTTEISFYAGSNLEFTHLSNIGSAFLARRSDPTVFEYFSESLAGELQNSLDYYTGQFSTEFSSQVYIYGDLAYSDDLVNMLTDRFGFSFMRFPIGGISCTGSSREECQSTLPVCLPATAAALCTARLANLLPPNRKNQLRIRHINRLGIVAALLLGLALITGWIMQRMSVTSAQERLGASSRQLEIYRGSEAYAAYSRIKQQIAVDQSYLEKIRQSPSFLGLSLKELSRLTPSSIRLSDLDYNASQPNQNLELRGEVRSTTVPPEIILAEYVEALTSSPFYADITVKRHVKRRVGDQFRLEFELTAKATV